MTDGKTGDVTVARTWTFPAGSVVVADRAYLDFGWLHQLQQRGVTFVTRLKRNDVVLPVRGVGVLPRCRCFAFRWLLALYRR